MKLWSLGPCTAAASFKMLGFLLADVTSSVMLDLRTSTASLLHVKLNY